jgi:hypothetical protein
MVDSYGTSSSGARAVGRGFYRQPEGHKKQKLVKLIFLATMPSPVSRIETTSSHRLLLAMPAYSTRPAENGAPLMGQICPASGTSIGRNGTKISALVERI